MSDNGSKTIELPGSITVRDLAQRMEASPIQIIKILMSNGVMANINQLIDFDTASVVASEMGYDANMETVEEAVIPETGEIPLWRQVILKEDPKQLVEEAFLRRIHYKIRVESPTVEQYERIFRHYCDGKDIPYDPNVTFIVGKTLRR